MKGLVALLWFAAMGWADDAKPLPVRRSIILKSGGKYFVEGRQKIRWGQELSIQKGTKIVGRGHGAVLVVAGALQVRGIKDAEVLLEDLTIEIAERCERAHFEAVKMNRCRIRTPEQKTCEADVHFEEADVFETSLDLRLHKGEVTILNSDWSGSIKIVSEALPGKKASVKAFINTSHTRDMRIEGLNSLVLRACNVNGQSVSFHDCTVLTFDANVVKAPTILFAQSKPGRFKKTKLQKSDFHDTVLVFKAPRVGKKKDKIPVDKCWFGGLTKKAKILKRFIRDGNSDESSGVYLVFRKINKRELKLGGRTTKPRK